MNTELPADHVDLLFRSVLGRPPENEQTRQAFQRLGSVELAIAQLRASPEAETNTRSGPFWNFHSQIDAIGIIRAHEDTQRGPRKDRLVNFLGVVIDPAFLPHVLAGAAGQVEGPPIPANWHADMAEFAAALRAVDLAKGTFRILELGCGWGCWLLNTGVAARNRGLEVELIGAEGDAGHVAFAQRGCAENGFTDNEARVHLGVVGPKPGTALFPKQDTAGVSWGLEPVFDATPEQVRAAKAGQQYDTLPVLTLEALANGKPLDLIHMDIQGGEASFVEACIGDLNKLAAYIVIGTHSRAIEGRIMELMLSTGWVLEIERPAIYAFDGLGKPQLSVDGVQGWRNPELRPI